jgi:HK97 family phage portal protein
MWKPFTKSKAPELKAVTTTDTDGWFPLMFNGSVMTAAGVSISNDTALQISAVFNSIRIIGEDIAKLPLQVFKRLDKGREKRSDNNIWRIFNESPNPEMDAMSFRNTLQGHILGYGNGYAEIVRDGDGEVDQLWIIDPSRVIPKRRQDGSLYYQVTTPSGQPTEVSPSKIFRIPGFGFDGVTGYNVITYARQSLGLARAAEDYGSKFFGNGAKASLVFEMPQELTEKSSKNLIKSIQSQVSNQNQHGILLAEQGAKFSTLSVSQKDSQYLETRQFSVSDIARWFRMQPHKIGDLSKATFSNIEQQSLEYVGDTLTPWFVRWEQAIRMQLMTPDQKADNLYVKHNANALLRGDLKSRYEAYSSGIMNGWFTRNEAREREELNPIDGLDEPLVPLNMSVVGEEPVDSGTKNNTNAFIEDAAARITTAEEHGLSARVDKANDDRDRFNEWVNCFYEKHEQYIIKCISPLGLSQKTADRMVVEGILNITMSDDPSAHIKTWNRKQEIVDIIKEALLCTTK